MMCFHAVNLLSNLAVTFLFAQVGVMVTREFIDYISTRPLQVEVFGHYQHHPHNLPSKHLPRYDNKNKFLQVLVKSDRTIQQRRRQ